MSLFYIRHHYLSIVRSKSFGGEVMAFLFLLFFSFKFAPSFYNSLDSSASYLASIMDLGDNIELFFLLVYWLSDLLLRMILKRPYPKLKYYLLLNTNTKSIAAQYLVTSLFGIVPFLLYTGQLMVIKKAWFWFGDEIPILVFGLFLLNHYAGLFFQFSGRRGKSIFMMFFTLLTLCVLFLPIEIVGGSVLHPITIFIALVALLVVSFRVINGRLKERVFFENKRNWSFFDLIPSIGFKNPLFQLEWTLLVRNKRTRTNILMGMISILILPFLIDAEAPRALFLMFFMIGTSFFIIQHGVYSLGWEGSFFDFLMTNVSTKDFLRSRYYFYAFSCLVGFIICSIASLLNGLPLDILICFLFFNVGITIPLVLYRSVFNSTKIELGENSFFNYNGMLTGPILISSFLVIVVPLILYGISYSFFKDDAIYFLGGLGLLGIVFRNTLLKFVAGFMTRKKYHLSQSFKS